jgi:hypothetical protein
MLLLGQVPFDGVLIAETRKLFPFYYDGAYGANSQPVAARSF